MQHLQYFTHLILHSNYRLVINLLILSLIYFCLYANNIIYCMTEDLEEIPMIIEDANIIDEDFLSIFTLEDEFNYYYNKAQNLEYENSQLKNVNKLLVEDTAKHRARAIRIEEREKILEAKEESYQADILAFEQTKPIAIFAKLDEQEEIINDLKSANHLLAEQKAKVEAELKILQENFKI